jgi:hypothetical protein
MPQDTQYYGSCELIAPKRYLNGKPNPTYYKMTYNLWSNKWYNKFKQSWYNKDVNKYNKCLIRSRDGRAKAQLALDCSIDENKGKYECKVELGANTAFQPITNPYQVPGKRQTGLGDDEGNKILDFENMDKNILFGGAALALFILLR